MNYENNKIPAEVWAKMDRFDRAWYNQSEAGTLLESEREKVSAAIYDHEACGNWDVSAVMMKFKYVKTNS